MDESTRIRIARARALSSNRYTAGISVPSEVVMARRVGSQANFFNGALVEECCAAAAAAEGYVLFLQLIDRGRGLGLGSRSTFTVTLNNRTISLASEQLTGGIKIGASGDLLPETAQASTRAVVLSSVSVEGPGSLKAAFSSGLAVQDLTFISTDPDVGDAGALSFGSLGSLNVSVEGYYASGGVRTGSSNTYIIVNNLEGGDLTIVSPSTVEYLLLSDTAIANATMTAAGLQAGAVAGTLNFFSVDEATGIDQAEVSNISAAITTCDPPGAAPTVSDVSDMSMVELSYGGAVPRDFDLQYWLAVTPDFTDVSAGTLVAENPFVPLSETNYYFKCLFARGGDTPLASGLSPASGLYFMPKAPDYTATNAAVTLAYTGINTPPGATVVYYVGGTASHSGLTQLPSNVFTYGGPSFPLYFFCQLLLAGGAGATVISPATGPVSRPSPP